MEWSVNLLWVCVPFIQKTFIPMKQFPKNIFVTASINTYKIDNASLWANVEKNQSFITCSTLSDSLIWSQAKKKKKTPVNVC